MDNKEQHATGAHYTYEKDIMKIIRPTIIQPFIEKINKTKTLENLLDLREELGNLKILDPACGSGNFLYLALRELKNLELEILSKINDNFSSYKIQNLYSVVQTNQFYGLDINPFAIELAKVTLSFGKKIFNDLFLDYIKNHQLSFSLIDKTLPFDDLDNNLIVEDALFYNWPKADIIIGNPPFLGGKYLREEHGDEYAEKIYEAFPETKGQPDFCVFWFQIANKSLAKHVGLVGTNSIAQGVSRKASLEYITNNGGFITNAVSTQVWSGEAKVHVSIVNWVKNKNHIPPSIFLDDKKVKQINASLKAEKDFTVAKQLKDNLGKSFEGCQLAGKGFIISAETAQEWIGADVKNKKILKPMIDGKALVTPGIKLEWVIDFNNMPLEEASKYIYPFEYVKLHVKPERMNNKEESRKNNWWLFGRPRPKMRSALNGLDNYFCLPKVAKYTCFQSIDISILPCEANMVIASDDFFVLGILNSKLHLDWVLAQSSTLKADTRYTNTTCFLTFPFPKNVTESQQQKVREVMVELEDFRKQECISRSITITTLYNNFYNEPSSKLFKFHQKLDSLACGSYGWKYNATKNYNDNLLSLNNKREEK
ncbi:MAG: class I SAM-dependent DNA methyltransferase [Ignavibacteriae bacterium]|nr:class I SAM-dependent DNA methyltransferase [Ignavibacteriota bacterium]